MIALHNILLGVVRKRECVKSNPQNEFEKLNAKKRTEPNRTEPNNKNKQQHEKMIFDNAKRSKDLNVDQFYFLKLALSH